MAQIHVVHETPAWVAPLFDALERGGLPYRDRHRVQGAVDRTEAPPEGVFYDRTSASSHTRRHRSAPEPSAAPLTWLESHERRVLNGGRALQPEAEACGGISGMAALATFLGREPSAPRLSAGAAPAAD